MKNRIYGLIGIKAVMANWNADFTGYPKSTSDGNIYGSDKALKYPMKKMWEAQGEKILYIKSYKEGSIQEKKAKKKKSDDTINKEEKLVIQPKSLKERYEDIFNIEDLKKEKSTQEIMKKLFEVVDIKNFGATFATDDINLSITGAVQIAQGFNKYEGTSVEIQSILSPFRDSKKKDAKNSTLGSKIMSDEAHYIYNFCINPQAYDEYIKLGVTEGYTREDYEKFKDVALVSATSFNTNSKAGCENELSIFIEVEENQYLPNLESFVKFEKNYDGKDIYHLEFDQLLNDLGDKIKSVEVYYNPYLLEIKTSLKGVKYFNIFTRKEV